jgi:pyruvate dehydrogenase complex dehydrogenase (E1) component
VATLYALSEAGSVAPTVVADAIDRYDLDPEAVNPLHA